jgi:hypothetical protein
MAADYSTPSTTAEPSGSVTPQTTSEPCAPQTTSEPCGGWATPATTSDQTPLHAGNRDENKTPPTPTPCGSGY